MVRRTLPAALFIAFAGLLLGAGQAAAYDVVPGDTLWGISHRSGVPVERIARDNHLADPNRILVGQHLVVGDRPAMEPVAAVTPVGPQRVPEAVRGEPARQLLLAAAREAGLNPNFVLAVSYWESGFDQTRISVDGAIGLMQILPLTAQWAGPALLGRQVDIYVARDNARLGAALLRRYLDEFDDPKLALAAYYQGERAAREHGIFASSRRYVDGIWALRNLFQAANQR